MLSLGSKGEVRYKALSLSSDFPVGLRVGEKALSVELPTGIQPRDFKLTQPFPGGRVTVTAPGNWALSKPLPGVKLNRSAAGVVLNVPSGLKVVTLVRRN